MSSNCNSGCGSSDSSSSSSSSSSSCSSSCKTKPKHKAQLYKDCKRCTILCARLTPDGCRCNRKNCNGCNAGKSRKECSDDHLRSGYGNARIECCFNPKTQTATVTYNIEYSKLHGGKVLGVEFRGPVNKCRHQAPIVLDASGIYRVAAGTYDSKDRSRQLDCYVVGIAQLHADQANELLSGKWYITVRTEKFADCEGEIRGKVKPVKDFKCSKYGYANPKHYDAFGGAFNEGDCNRVKFCKKGNRDCCSESSSSSSSSSSDCCS